MSCRSGIEIVVAKCGVFGHLCKGSTDGGRGATTTTKTYHAHSPVLLYCVIYDHDGIAPKFRHNAMTRLGRVRRRFFVLCKKIEEKEVLGYDLVWKHGYY